jgi:hypothetical protein
MSYYVQGMLRIKKSNLKVGKDTLILNITSARRCPSKALGMCKVPEGKCYADRAERLYSGVLPYRNKQEMYWKAHYAGQIIDDILGVISRMNETPRYLRVGESGDFRKQHDIEKLSAISEALWYLKGVTTYCYSARNDLDFSNAHFLCKGSGHDSGNNGRVDVLLPGEDPKNSLVCPGNCRFCDICKTRNKKHLYIPLH